MQVSVAMTHKDDTPENKAAKQMRTLLDSDPGEEQVHQFFSENVLKVIINLFYFAVFQSWPR